MYLVGDQKLSEKFGVNPVEKIYDKVKEIWGGPDKTLSVEWSLSLKIWQRTK